MDFFESQDIARRNTRLLLFLFLMAVASLILLTNILVFASVNVQDTARMSSGAYYFSWDVFFAISAGVVLLITLASLFRLAMLRKGGSTIAELMDGELLVNANGDFNKQKLLNVVEEMAIASGTPVPPVYLINEQAINAFAAGYSPGDAVIGVTVGAIQNLNRDQLQGVIAHEFSHILNGDMRLNIRLMGILYGILMMALIGRMIVRPGHRLAGSRDRTHAGVLAFGVGLLAIGYLGQFFGNLIKAAVSRQREYLADASAVQFTRNPQGIADALKRIGGYQQGSVMQHPESEELSHTFFSQAVTFSFNALMATHPPLNERIKRIDASWNGQFLESVSSEQPADAAMAEGTVGFASPVNISAEHVLAHIGRPEQSQIQLAKKIIKSLPDHFVTAAHEPYSARALVYLFLLSPADDIRSNQLSTLQTAADLGVFETLQQLLNQEHLLAAEMKLPLLEMAFPALGRLSYEQYKMFSGNLDMLVQADGKVGLSEWAVLKMVEKHLGANFESRHIRVRHDSLEAVVDHCSVLLSLLAHCDRESRIAPELAFQAAAEELGIEVRLLATKELGFSKLNRGLDELAALHPLRKPKLIKACIRSITADEVVSTIEAELLRTIADTLECPMPPILDIQS